jgi:energy-coupling factor transporter ATP-binding protein EcfA2
MAITLIRHPVRRRRQRGAARAPPGVQALVRRAWRAKSLPTTKRHGEKVAVDDLTFQVKPGIVTGFLGPNGAGKSTTMRMILGLDAPTSGSVTINDQAYRDLPAPLLARACTEDAEWRERGAVLRGRAETRACLRDMWEHDGRLCARLWTFGDDRIAVRVAHEQGGRRTQGYELWRFDGDGLLALRSASLTAA